LAAGYSDVPRTTNAGRLYDQSVGSQKLFAIEIFDDFTVKTAALGWQTFKAKSDRPFRVSLPMANAEKSGCVLALLGFRPGKPRGVFLHTLSSVPEIKLRMKEESDMPVHWHVGIALAERGDVERFIGSLPKTEIAAELAQKISEAMRSCKGKSGMMQITAEEIGIEIGFGPNGFMSHGFHLDIRARESAYSSGDGGAAKWARNRVYGSRGHP